MKTEE